MSSLDAQNIVSVPGRSDDGVSLREGLAPVLFAVTVAVVFFIGRSIFSPLLLDIERAFDVTHSASSRLMVTFTVGYAISMFFSGFVSQYLTHRRLIPTAAFLGAAGMAVLAFAPGMGVMRIGLWIFGIGSGLFSPTIINMITTVVRRRDWQKALSINELSPHSGMILAPLLVAVARPFVPWRGILGIMAAMLVIVALLFMRFVHEGERYGRAPNLTTIGTLVKMPAFWFLILFFVLALSGTDGVYLLIPTFLIVEGGVAPQVANTVFGISRFTPIVSLSLAALVFHRFGPRYTITFALVGQGIAILLLGLTTGWIRFVIVFLQPAIGALFFPAGFSALSSLLPAESRNIGISFVLPVAVFLGIGVIPATVGHLGDIATFARGFVILGVVMVILGFTSLSIRFYSDS